MYINLLIRLTEKKWEKKKSETMYSGDFLYCFSFVPRTYFKMLTKKIDKKYNFVYSRDEGDILNLVAFSLYSLCGIKSGFLFKECNVSKIKDYGNIEKFYSALLYLRIVHQ